MPGSRRALAALPLLLLLATPAWGYGRLELEAHPKSARVWVDGAPAGGVPTTIDLTAGRHDVKVAARGWQATQFRVHVQNGKATVRSLRLAPGGTKVPVRHRPYHPAGPHHPTLKVAPRPVAHAAPAVHEKPVAAHVAPTPVRPRPVAVPVPLAPAPGLDAGALPLPAPAIAPPELVHPPELAPPPEPTPPVPAPPVPTAAPAPVVQAWPTIMGLDARSWADLGWLTILGSIVGGLVGLVAQRLQGPRTWHARRPRRELVFPAGEGDQAPADAWAALVAGNWELAAQLLWASQPASPWVYYHLGLAYEHLGHELEAEAAYRTAVAADPTFAAAGYNLGVLLDRLGLAPQAAIAYRRLLEACPTDVDALFNLGHLCHELGLPQQAEVHWTVARALAPRDVGVGENLKALKRERRRFSLPWRPAAAPRPA